MITPISTPEIFSIKRTVQLTLLVQFLRDEPSKTGVDVLLDFPHLLRQGNAERIVDTTIDTLALRILLTATTVVILVLPANVPTLLTLAFALSATIFAGLFGVVEVI